MSPGQLCNFKANYLPPRDFVLYTCMYCHVYLFNGAFPPSDCRSDQSNATDQSSETSRIHVISAPNSSFTIQLDCSHLSKSSHCSNWKKCCEAADLCCQQQIEWNINRKPNEIEFFNSHAINSNSQSSSEFCEYTWDGFSCFSPAQAGTVVTKSCPSFYASGVGYKSCLSNGSWFAKEGQPWTDYTDCVPAISTSKFAFGVVLSTFSIIALSLSLATFLLYRELWRRIRIKIHASLFFSILFYNIAVIPLDITFIVYSRDDDKLVDISRTHWWWLCMASVRYFKVATFGWMFCEGLYLLRLLRNGLKPPHNTSVFFAIGWGFPSAIIFIYYMATLLKREYTSSTQLGDDKSNPRTHPQMCVYQVILAESGSEEDEKWIEWWIILFPCLLSILINFGFLTAIFRIMKTAMSEKDKSTGLRRHSSIFNSMGSERRYMEKEGTHKATKAMFLLSPLLGTYVLFTLLQPPDKTDEKWGRFYSIFIIYEFFQVLADRIQGLVVSIAFCFSTEQVIDLYAMSLLRRNITLLQRRSSSQLSLPLTRETSKRSIHYRHRLRNERFDAIKSEPTITSLSEASSRPAMISKLALSNNAGKAIRYADRRTLSNVTKRELDVIPEVKVEDSSCPVVVKDYFTPENFLTMNIPFADEQEDMNC